MFAPNIVSCGANILLSQNFRRMRHKRGSISLFIITKFHCYGYLSRSLRIAIIHSYVNNSDGF